MAAQTRNNDARQRGDGRARHSAAALAACALPLMFAVHAACADSVGVGAPQNEAAAISPKIIGGTGADIHDDPWQVSIQFVSTPEGVTSHVCGGVIIHPDWVLTAAHCVDRNAGPANLVVASGHSRLDGNLHLSRVNQVALHPGWNRDLRRDDIALLRIDRKGLALQGRPVDGPGARPMADGQWPTLRVTGWGVSTQPLRATTQLQQIDLRAEPLASCASDRRFGKYLTPKMICAASERFDRNFCDGDSGGPATAEIDGRRRLLGIVSFTIDTCIGRGAFGIFTRVASYTGWIREATNGAVGWQ